MSDALTSHEFRPADATCFDLPEAAIHIWSVPLASSTAANDSFMELSEDERRRAERFHFLRDRNRFVTCRARLRRILAGYCRCDPLEVQFQYGGRGKPALVALHGRPPLYFNISHSHDLALMAFRRHGELGVDVERLRTIDELEGIARRYFTAREGAILQGLPQTRRAESFFRAWTRKEAILKAIGVGLSFSLNQVEVTLEVDAPARLLSLQGENPDGPHAWRLYHLEPEPGYLGAVAAQGALEHLVGWRGNENLPLEGSPP